MRIVHHSTQALADLVNDVYDAHRPPPMPASNGEAIANGGPVVKHAMSKPSIEVWILQVCSLVLFRTLPVRCWATLEPGAD